MSGRCLRALVGTAVGLFIAGLSIARDPARRASELAPARAAEPSTVAVGHTETGLGVFYSKSLQGHKTASGEPFDNNAMTTAHHSLPFGTKLKVTNLKNDKSTIVRVNDRGPTQPERIVDLSQRAAGELDFLKEGITQVKIEVLELPSDKPM